jgi:hypothetical protein
MNKQTQSTINGYVAVYRAKGGAIKLGRVVKASPAEVHSRSSGNKYYVGYAKLDNVEITPQHEYERTYE